jgi:sugar lactone lactonase YvrE
LRLPKTPNHALLFKERYKIHPTKAARPNGDEGASIIHQPLPGGRQSHHHMKSSSRIQSRLVLAGLLGFCSFFTMPALGQISSPVPVIDGFTPPAATNGSLITITGTNFSATAADDLVWFGTVQGVVTSASATNLTVSAPVSASFAPITETVNGLTAASLVPFLPEFPGAGVFTNTSLGSRVDLNLGSSAGLLVIADLDGDGKPDLALSTGDHHVYIYRNISTNGVLTTGSFAPPLILPLPGAGDYGSILAADLTGDGKPDLLIADDVNNVVIVLKNLCTPGTMTTNSFGPPVTFPSGPTATGLAVGDLDGDGKPDIATANGGGNTVSVLLNLSSPGVITTNSFASAVQFNTGTVPKYVAMTDIDGDGVPDLLTVNNGDSGALSVLRNISTPGNLAFETNVTFAGLAGSYAIAVGDLDGDGKPDVVIGVQNSQAVSVFRNTSIPGSITSNSFAPRVDFPVSGWVNWVALADLDGGGKLDVLATGQMPDQLLVYQNTSTRGSFNSDSLAAPVVFTTGWNPICVAVDDLDGDGRPDIVFANNYSGTVSVYQNLAPFSGPPVITLQPASQAVSVGGTASLSVAASGGGLGYEWSFNETNLSGATNASLVLTNFQLSQAGDYQVVVTNSYGSVTSSIAVLSAILPPVITVQPASQTVTNGVNVNLAVAASGADLSYQWLFNGIPLVANNIITTVAGNNSLGGSYSGDGGAATNAGLSYAADVAVDRAGNLYVADTFNFVIRKVDASGTITTAAGNNSLGAGYSGDGGAATNAALNYPNGVAVDSTGNLYIADSHNHVIRKVDVGGRITTVAGNYSLGGGYSGDGGAATNAALNFPTGVKVDGSGNLDIAEYGNNVIRKVDARGLISTVAGNQSLGGGYSGDGGAATNAGLSLPTGVAVDGAGNLYFSEGGNHVIRKVDAGGTITTLAGNQSLGGGYSGDGGAATNAALNHPNDVAVDGAGNLYIAEYGNNVIRKVDAHGIISTAVGNYSLGGGYSGDGGPATNAALNNPVGVGLDGLGNLYIGDAHNNVVRKVAAPGFNQNPTNGTLTLTDVQAALAGNYQVIVSNPAGSITSSIVKLVVYAAPIITSQPASQTVSADGSATFEVSVLGVPPVKYQWNFNGVKISGATNAWLTVTNVHLAQAGDYSVKISTPDGSLTSSNALLTVITPTLLVYNFSTTEYYVGDSLSTADSYAGQLIYQPAATNGTFVGWGLVNGKKRCWLGDFGGYTFYTMAGIGKQTFTVLGQSGQDTDPGGSPSFWSAVYQGQNTQLTIGTRKYYSFPSVLSGTVTEIYPDPNTGNLIRYESSSSYSFAAPATQTANNTGETTTDLINALIKTLTAQGYKN